MKNLVQGVFTREVNDTNNFDSRYNIDYHFLFDTDSRYKYRSCSDMSKSIYQNIEIFFYALNYFFISTLITFIN